MISINVIGDEIYAGGVLVGVLSLDHCDHNLMTAFTDALGEVHLFDHRTDEVELAMEQPDDISVLNDLLRDVRPFVKGGWVSYADLTRIANQLKEEE